MKRAALLLAAFLAAGCVSPGARDGDRYFLLEAPGAAAPAPAAHVRVALTTTASFYDTQDIVYSRAAGTRAYYQFNHWTERPQRAIHAQLAARLQGGGASPTLTLRTQLVEIYHDAAESPGTARIALTAELVDPARGVIARRSFTRSAPAASYDAPGAVRGFNDALGALLDEVVAWVGTEAQPVRR